MIIRAILNMFFQIFIYKHIRCNFIHRITTSIVALTNTKLTDITQFRHPPLTEHELSMGTRLGFDTWADTSCAGKHAYVEAFIEGRIVTASGFSATMGTMDNLRIAHVVYAYDLNDGNTLLLENNNAIYMGDAMTDSLINPLQCEDNQVRIDVRPEKYHGNNSKTCQRIIFEDGFEIPIEYEGVLPFITVRKPTPYELDVCERRQLTSDHNWLPHEFRSNLMPITTTTLFASNDIIHDQLQCTHLHHMLSSTTLLHEDSNTGEFLSWMKMTTNQANALSPEALSKKW